MMLSVDLCFSLFSSVEYCLYPEGGCCGFSIDSLTGCESSKEYVLGAKGRCEMTLSPGPLRRSKFLV